MPLGGVFRYLYAELGSIFPLSLSRWIVSPVCHKPPLRVGCSTMFSGCSLIPYRYDW